MNRRLAAFAAAGLSFAAFLTSAKAGDDDLAKAIEKAAAMERYTFQIDEKPGKGAGTGVEGAYQKGQPVSLKADQVSFFKSGDVLVYKQGDAWKRTKRGIESDPLVILVPSAKVSAARLPHEELSGLGKALKEVKKGDKADDGSTAYTADLTEEGARKLAPTESQGVAKGGTAKVWLDADGTVVKYAVSIRLQGKLGNADVDGTAEKTVKIGDVGTAKVEVPEGAKKALE